MMMMGRVMCVLAVVLCCTCGYTMAAAAAVDNDSPSGRGVSRGAVEVSCGAGGALRVRPAAESEWLTCGAGSRVSACGKYADLCRQRTARTATRKTTRTAIIANTATTTTTTTTNGIIPDVGVKTPVVEQSGWGTWDDFLATGDHDTQCADGSDTKYTRTGIKCSIWKEFRKETSSQPIAVDRREPHTQQQGQHVQNHELTPNQRVGITDGDHPGQDNSVVVSPGVPAESKEESTLVPSPELSPTKAAESRSAPEGTLESERTENPTKGEHTTEGVDTNQTNPQTQSENTTTSSQETNTTTNSTAGNSNATQQSPATDDVTAASESQEPTSTTPSSTENTTTEAPTTTPSPVPVTDTQISSNIASNVQNRPNVDSSVNPVWMRTAAPLLIVVVLVSATVY